MRSFGVKLSCLAVGVVGLLWLAPAGCSRRPIDSPPADTVTDPPDTLPDTTPSPPPPDFYYGIDRTIPVLTDSSKVMIQPTLPLTPEDLIVALESFERVGEYLPNVQPVDRFLVFSLAPAEGYWSFLDSIQALVEIQFAEPFYTLESGTALYIGQSFIAAFEAEITPAQVVAINANYQVTVQQRSIIRPHVYMLLNSPSSGSRTLELSNLYHNLEETQYAAPNWGYGPTPD